MTEGFNEEDSFSRKEAKETRLPEGSFSGLIKRAKRTEKGDISFGIQLADNDDSAVMQEVDGEGNTTDTAESVNGAYTNYSIWMPRAEHKNKTTGGGQNSYQWRLNNLATEMKRLGIEWETEADIWAIVNDGEFIEKEVVFLIKHEEYPVGSGTFSAKIPLNKLSRSQG